MREPTLLPTTVARTCPFCGHLAAIEPWHGGGRDKRSVGCSNDDCAIQPSVCGSTRNRALIQWNTRSRKAEEIAADAR